VYWTSLNRYRAVPLGNQPRGAIPRNNTGHRALQHIVLGVSVQMRPIEIYDVDSGGHFWYERYPC
jgi:hypothetical protein